MKKKVLASLMAAVMALGLAACGGSSASGTASGTTGGDASGDPEVKLVMAEVNPLDTIVGMTDKYFVWLLLVDNMCFTVIHVQNSVRCVKFGAKIRIFF